MSPGLPLHQPYDQCEVERRWRRPISAPFPFDDQFVKDPFESDSLFIALVLTAKNGVLKSH